MSDIPLDEVRALVAGGHGQTHFIANLYRISSRHARRLLAEARGRREYCPRCDTYLAHDGPLSWCPDCAWEPPESAAQTAPVPCDDDDEPEPANPVQCPICRVDCWPGAPLHMHVLSHSIAHGTLTSYVNGCHCDPCRGAMAAYMRQRRKRQSA